MADLFLLKAPGNIMKSIPLTRRIFLKIFALIVSLLNISLPEKRIPSYKISLKGKTGHPVGFFDYFILATVLFFHRSQKYLGSYFLTEPSTSLNNPQLVYFPVNK